MVAYLEKSTGSAGFHPIIDFITRSHIHYALTKKPEVCVSFIRQFWRSAEIVTDDDGTVKIHATIDGHSLSITEGSLRRHLKLDDQDGITSLPTTEIFEQLRFWDIYESDKLNLQKGAFSPQWRIESLVVDLVEKEKLTVMPIPRLFLGSENLSLKLRGRKLSNEEVQEKASTATELFIQEVTPTEVIQDQEGSEKASDEVSTAGLKKGPVSEEVLTVSTVEVNLSTAGGTVTYSRRSAEKRSRKDKGKAILIEEEPKKKSKKDLEQEQLSYAEAIRLEEQMNEEQRAQIARDEEIARQWDEEERKRAMDAAKSTKKIDWNDPSVIRYHSLKMKPKTIAQARRNMIKYLKNQGNYKISDFKGMSYNDIRPIFEKIWDFNQNIKPMDAEQGSGKQKSPQKSPEKSPAKEKSPEKVVEEESETQEELKEGVKEPTAKRKKSIPRKTTRKRQKLEEDAEK
ncbi:hypothetical protein Tco_0086513 [Tanacetum coccineum]